MGAVQPMGGLLCSPGLAHCGILTCIGGPIGKRQIGSCSPRPGAKVLLALAAVLPRGVVLALALKAALFEGAQVGVEVAFTPGRRRQEQSCQAFLLLSLAFGTVLSLCMRGEAQPITHFLLLLQDFFY